MSYTRPEMTEERVRQINELIQEHPNWTRSRLSQELCELWEWKSAVGQLKDISCRDVLRALDTAGKIKLPSTRGTGRKKGGNKQTSIQGRLFELDELDPFESIEAKLKTFMPLVVEISDAPDKIKQFKTHIEQYHYLGYGQSVGECMRYTLKSRDGDPLACFMFGSTAWRCAPRDTYIGWTDEERKSALYLTTNNTRFLILPWVKVPHLASHALALISRRISSDWLVKYGHPVYLLETFVERDRFAGTCYKAANWTCVGKTTGRGRDSINHQVTLPVKDVYVLPLTKDFRKKLCGQQPQEDST